MKEPRKDLTKEEAERLVKFGSLRFRSVEEVLPPRRITQKFIPSKEQH